ncbi:MAG: MBL fold metallo-hydrolase [Candidatus Hodarchaeales archaeon]
MIIFLIGARGTVPTATTATTSFLIDNHFLFECPSEIIQALQQIQEEWVNIAESSLSPETRALGKPSFSKIHYIILSHLHFDHWGGLPHIIHRILLLEREKREKNPLKIIIPKFSTLTFQKRMREEFNISEDSSPLPDDEFFYRLLSIEIGESVRDVIKVIVIDDSETIDLEQNYLLTAKKNSHLLRGSVAYKLQHTITKLNVEVANKLSIPFDSTLSRIQKSDGIILVNGQEISRDMIFYDINTIIGYSGDTKTDEDLFQFFTDVQILIHETTYLSQNETYHLDLHSDIDSVIDNLRNLENVKIFIPVHYSIRYSDVEVKERLHSLKPKLNNKITLIDSLSTFLIEYKNNRTIFHQKENYNLKSKKLKGN